MDKLRNLRKLLKIEKKRLGTCKVYQMDTDQKLIQS